MLKDQIISLFMLFPKIKKGGIFIIEEIDFPEKREDMRIGQNFPDLKTILKKIISKDDFYSDYITDNEKKYLLSNIESISFFKGNFNEIAVLRKKWFLLFKNFESSWSSSNFITVNIPNICLRKTYTSSDLNNPTLTDEFSFFSRW